MSSYPDPTGSPQPNNRAPVPVSAGFFRDMINELRLTWRLFFDPRVPMWTKAIPPIALIYVASPADFLPDVIPGLGQLDDLAAIVLGVRMFVEMCPPEIVHEHRRALAGASGAGWSGASGGPESGPVVDSAWRVVDPDEEQEP